MRYANQVAIITGASSGLGWELAKALAAEGAAVGVLARRKDRLDALVAEIQAKGGRAAAAAVDVSDRKRTIAAIRSLRDQLGPIDLLVANSGIGRPTLVDPINHEDIDAMFQINTMGVVNAIEAVLPEMIERRKGHIAGVSSLAAYLPMPGESGYCASKAAASMYLDCLRLHMRDYGIDVTTICPGFIETPMTETNTFKMPWLMQPDVASRCIVNALYRKKKVYNFPWQLTFLIKFARWMPDWLVAWVLRGKAGERQPGMLRVPSVRPEATQHRRAG
ncbi:MAG: SDR family NAD(P)-dependent oxidoreductase [Gemmataceae bacterium]|nr:SDR family NAD(P)-dependent oxidoreductase [Gemmataceae bacterium]